MSEKIDRNVFLSARNVPNTNMMNAADVNTYVLMNNNALVLTESGLEIINKF